jgi:hypothetical protein
MGKYKDLCRLSKKSILRNYLKSVPYRKSNYGDSTKNPSSSSAKFYSFIRNGRDIYRNRILHIILFDSTSCFNRNGGVSESSDDVSNNSDDGSEQINKNYDCNDFNAIIRIIASFSTVNL